MIGIFCRFDSRFASLISVKIHGQPQPVDHPFSISPNGEDPHGDYGVLETVYQLFFFTILLPTLLVYFARTVRH